MTWFGLTALPAMGWITLCWEYMHGTTALGMFATIGCFSAGGVVLAAYSRWS